MADKEIGDLTVATTPLAGTELVHIVQDGNSRQTPVSSLAGPGVAGLEFALAQLALEMSASTGIALILGSAGNRFADSFGVFTYVNVAGGTNADTSVAGRIKATKTVGARITGGTASDSAINDDNTATSIATPLNNLIGAPVSTRVLGSINFGSPVAISRIEARCSYPGGVSGCGLWYGNDGNNWTQLGTDFAITGSLATYQRDGLITAQYIAFVVPALSFSGTAITLNDLNAYVQIPANMTIASTGLSAATEPGAMKALIRVKENETAAAGTDYTLECSRDGGTTWSAMTLTEKFTTPAGLRVVEGALTDVSGQPSGTAPSWRFKALNNKDVELRDVYLEWS